MLMPNSTTGRPLRSRFGRGEVDDAVDPRVVGEQLRRHVAEAVAGQVGRDDFVAVACGASGRTARAVARSRRRRGAASR